MTIGISVGLLGKSRRVGCDIGKKTVEKILHAYTDLNHVWLLTGYGDMITPSYIVEELQEIHAACAEETKACGDRERAAESFRNTQSKQSTINEVSSKLDEVKELMDRLTELKHEKECELDNNINDIIIDDSEPIDESTLTISDVYKFVLRQNKVILNLCNELTELKEKIWNMEHDYFMEHNDFEENISR